MHGFLHGIRRVFPAACAGLLKCSCFPILALLSDGSHDAADNADLQQKQPQEGLNNGALPPSRGGDADNVDLQPAYEEGHKKEKGAFQPKDNGAENKDLQPALCEGQDDGSLPQARRDENKTAVNTAMQYLQGEEMGLLQPLSGEDEGILPHMKGDTDGSITEQGQHKINAWLLPSPRPRVKMKAEIQLLYMITGVLDPGIRVDHMNVHAWEHDAWTCPTSTSSSSNLRILFKTRLHEKLPVRVHGEDDVTDFFLIH